MRFAVRRCSMKFNVDYLYCIVVYCCTRDDDQVAGLRRTIDSLEITLDQGKRREGKGRWLLCSLPYPAIQYTSSVTEDRPALGCTSLHPNRGVYDAVVGTAGSTEQRGCC